MLDVLRSKDKSVKSEEASTAQAETPHPFHAAAASGDAAACRAWLRSAGGVDAAGDDGVTALMYACSMSQAPIVKLLLESGASVDRVSAATGETPLHWLAASAASAPGPFEDWLSCARLMLRAGATLSKKDKVGKTPIQRLGAFAPPEATSVLLGRPLEKATDMNDFALAGVMAARLIKARVSETFGSIDRPVCASVSSDWMKDFESQILAAISTDITEASGAPCEEILMPKKKSDTDDAKAEADARELRLEILRALNGGKHVLVSKKPTQRAPEGVGELFGLALDIPRFDAYTLAEACQFFHRLNAIPAIEDGDWIPMASPLDFVATRACAKGTEMQSLREHVLQRIASTKPAGGSVALSDLSGLGVAHDWARKLIADIAAANAGEIDWSEVDRGALLEGPPGTGKTSIARAIAAEAGVRMISTTATSWQASGALDAVLAAMSRDFDLAAEASPAILFIDEIDAIGSRESGRGGDGQHDQWVAWSVNHLLALMDGFIRDCPLARRPTPKAVAFASDS